MENNLKFNSAICTSRVQSERLLALGLKEETADMYYYFYDKNTYEINPTWKTIWEDRNDYKKISPAWSLHRLWELTPKVIFTKPSLYLTMCEDSVVYCAEDNYEEYEKSFSRQISLYDNIIDCIKWLIKEGYFNKEYLV